MAESVSDGKIHLDIKVLVPMRGPVPALGARRIGWLSIVIQQQTLARSKNWAMLHSSFGYGLVLGRARRYRRSPVGGSKCQRLAASTICGRYVQGER